MGNATEFKRLVVINMRIIGRLVMLVRNDFQWLFSATPFAEIVITSWPCSSGPCSGSCRKKVWATGEMIAEQAVIFLAHARHRLGCADGRIMG